MLKYSIAVNILYIQICKMLRHFTVAVMLLGMKSVVAQLCCVGIKIPN
jgi:hypothetical protein